MYRGARRKKSRENAAYRGVDGNQSKQGSSARARVIADGFRQH